MATINRLLVSCPKLDLTLRPQIPKEAREADRSLCRLQTLVLDAVGPLSAMLELHQAGNLTPEAAVEAATQSLKFLGNAHSNISSERRKKVATNLNKDLRPLVEEPERFSKAAPYLFGRDFEKSAREHVESVRSLRKLNARSASYRQGQFFRQGRSHQAARGAAPTAEAAEAEEEVASGHTEPGEPPTKRPNSKIEPPTRP